MTPCFRILSFYFLLFIFSTQVNAQNGLFDAEHSHQFATHLYSAAKYDAAALEFERLVLIDSIHKNDHRLMAIKSYRKAGKLKVGLKRFTRWYPDPLSHTENLEREFSLYLLQIGLYQDAESYISASKKLPKDESYLLLTIAQSYMGKWPEAATSLDQVTTASKERALLIEVVEKGTHQKRYRPGRAALLSIIPGLGRLYTGNYVDAGMSALAITTLSWQSYRGFNENGISSGYGWVLGALAAGFYLGNIYGSYRAALLKNRMQKLQIDADLNLALHMLD